MSTNGKICLLEIFRNLWLSSYHGEIRAKLFVFLPIEWKLNCEDCRNPLPDAEANAKAVRIKRKLVANLMIAGENFISIRQILNIGEEAYALRSKKVSRKERLRDE